MFVRDKDRNTRGPGAIAAMDEVSPNRRIAAARQERALARRDAIMALRTLGAVRVAATRDAVPPPVRVPARLTSTIETGQEAAFSRPPPPKKIKLMQRPRGLLVPGIRVKLPGSELPMRTDVKMPTPTAPLAPTSVIGPTAVAPKIQTVVVGGGASPMPGGSKAPSPVPDVPPMEPMEIPDPVGPASAAKPAKTQGNMLLYAAIGVGVLWLLTRKKT